MRSLRCIIISLLIALSPPFIGGIYYSGCGERVVEQRWLDRAIAYLQLKSYHCNNPEIKEALKYTIKRYNKIGAWNVMILPIANPFIEIDGCNVPWCPGITLDPQVMDYPINVGAMILVHESQHDYWPYVHPYVDAKMRRIGCL